jgi:hypothetical protein
VIHEGVVFHGFQVGVRACRRAKASAAKPISTNSSRAPPPPPFVEGVTFKVTELAGEVPTAFEHVNE